MFQEPSVEPLTINLLESSTDGDQEMLERSDEEGAGRQPASGIPRPGPARAGSRVNRSDSEEQISDSQVGSVLNSSDSESKYARKDRRPVVSPEQLAKRKLSELNDWVMRFAPVSSVLALSSFIARLTRELQSIFYSVELPQSWAPWHCPCPPLDMPFRSSQTLAHKHKCKYLIDVRKPSDDVVRLLSNSPERTDAELLKHLQTKPSIFRHPWDDLPVEILRRSIDLHREEHYAAWGVKRVVRQVRVNCLYFD
jgi:hypothetical protein